MNMLEKKLYLLRLKWSFLLMEGIDGNNQGLRG